MEMAGAPSELIMPGSTAYFVSHTATLVPTGGFVGYGDVGTVLGPATVSPYKGEDGAVDVRFQCGVLSCLRIHLITRRPPKLPLEFDIHETVWYTNKSIKKLELENGTRGEICGPASNETIAGQGADVYFSSLGRVFSCIWADLQRWPPAGSADALTAAAKAREAQRAGEEVLKEFRRLHAEGCKEALRRAIDVGDLEALRVAIEDAGSAGVSSTNSSGLLGQARELRDVLRKAARRQEKRELAELMRQPIVWSAQAGEEANKTREEGEDGKEGEEGVEEGEEGEEEGEEGEEGEEEEVAEDDGDEDDEDEDKGEDACPQGLGYAKLYQMALEWRSAKRRKDYVRADALRSVIRAAGHTPEALLPPSRAPPTGPSRGVQRVSSAVSSGPLAHPSSAAAPLAVGLPAASPPTAPPPSGTAHEAPPTAPPRSGAAHEGRRAPVTLSLGVNVGDAVQVRVLGADVGELEQGRMSRLVPYVGHVGVVTKVGRQLEVDFPSRGTLRLNRNEVTRASAAAGRVRPEEYAEAAAEPAPAHSSHTSTEMPPPISQPNLLSLPTSELPPVLPWSERPALQAPYRAPPETPQPWSERPALHVAVAQEAPYRAPPERALESASRTEHPTPPEQVAVPFEHLTTPSASSSAAACAMFAPPPCSLENDGGEGLPAQFLCPISHVLMIDPVFTADGHTYERSMIATWLATHDTSPLTNEVLAHKGLTPNIALRALIRERDLLSMASCPASTQAGPIKAAPPQPRTMPAWLPSETEPLPT